jgi:hypothetical protein
VTSSVSSGPPPAPVSAAKMRSAKATRSTLRESASGDTVLLKKPHEATEITLTAFERGGPSVCVMSLQLVATMTFCQVCRATRPSAITGDVTGALLETAS